MSPIMKTCFRLLEKFILKIGHSKNSSRFKRIFAEVTCRADVIPSKLPARFENRFGWVCDQSDSSKGEQT